MTHRTTPTGWFKSSRSNPAQDCVEVRFDGDRVLLRDTKDHGVGPVITMPAEHWDSFLAETNENAAASDPTIRIEHHASGETSLHAAGTTLTYTPAEWTAFRAGVVLGEFTLATTEPATI